ncbi:hypothetical protein [Micromonospora chersina]|uniref:hypothetical protein n=1 Tax=Micromonospora chersina TaxID=47854 RepID=UPI003D90F193
MAGTAATGRWVRLLLLLCTLVGLTAMHTLGHGAHSPSGQPAGHEEEIARGAHPDATALARQIVTTQQGEIDAMRKMLDRL